MSEHPWRTDAALAGKFHPSYPDDLQILVHDGEPRRTGRQPELCWVRILGVEKGPARPLLAGEEQAPDTLRRAVYVAQLLNQPQQLTSVVQGDPVRFFADPGGQHLFTVTAEYLAERAEWQIQPCQSCGLCEGLDPPSVMAATRFSGAEVVPIMFTSRCPLCGGTQLLKHMDAPAR